MAQRIPARLTTSEGRRFALTVGAVFLLLGTLAMRRERVILAATLLAPGVLLALAGVVTPGRLTRVYRAWMRVGLLLSKLMTPLVMAIVFFGVMMPVGLLRRAFGSRPGPAVGTPSYWTRRPNARSDLFRQF